MANNFSDHFSAVASDYAQYRPRYPLALFDWLASVAPAHELAWDCAAGSGQASPDLAAHFRNVIATDASAEQIAAAPPHAQITYRVATAEASGIDAHSVDLITVAQALHWFDLERFYTEVCRVLKPGGVFAAWCYGFFTCHDAAIDHCLLNYYENVVGPYWPPERVHIENGYRDLAFPFDAIEAPAFQMQTRWTLPQLLGYLRSWSAGQRYIKHTGVDPVARLQPELASLWGATDLVRTQNWPLTLRVGRIGAL
jgi:SAM-dependent methyltransferase